MFIFLGAVCYNCSSPHKKLFQQLASQKDKSKYPNEDSELALLMREMDRDMKAIKKAIVNQQKIPKVLKKFKAIHAATPTETDMKTPQFTTLAELLLTNTKKLYKTSQPQRAYNRMVRNCLACHQSYCPGPVVRIKKLMMSESSQ
ncbi:hypothetical protein BKI52_45000 [marine bacterium AO1-C]|nr:hypothetical protein BKI52_45000 [marine bacterium AO1-C]